MASNHELAEGGGHQWRSGGTAPDALTVGTGSVLPVDSPMSGSDIRSIPGCAMLSLLHLVVVARSSQLRDQRQPFRIYCDGAYRFVTDIVEDHP